MNGDTLDNRCANLRVVTNQENVQNRHGAASHSKTGILGVHYFKSHRGTHYWRAMVSVKKKQYAKCFPHTDEGLKAAAAYAALLRQRHLVGVASLPRAA